MAQTNLDQKNVFAAWFSLFTSGGTLICCALPALFVALGAGAVLAGLVKAVPGIVFFSEYKTAMFALAAVMLAISGALQWRQRHAPCPLGLNAQQASDCLRVRRFAGRVWLGSVLIFSVGVLFAFVLPALNLNH